MTEDEAGRQLLGSQSIDGVAQSTKHVKDGRELPLSRSSGLTLTSFRTRTCGEQAISTKQRDPVAQEAHAHALRHGCEISGTWLYDWCTDPAAVVYYACCLPRGDESSLAAIAGALSAPSQW